MSEPVNSPQPPTQIGKELTGRVGKYEITRQLGKGAMGIVYLAHDTELERDVALKVMAAGVADDPELAKRFKREAQSIAKLTHPNIVTVFDLGSHQGAPYIAMELLKGQDLAKTMRQGPMALDRIVSIIVQVLAGLGQAHQAGIIHRDIKPANIFLGPEGAVKIMDFGVAHVTAASMTGTGNIVGTADYMSPEQVKGAKVDGRSDLFSVGCMFYELLTGRRPFQAENLMAVFYRITHEEPDFSLIPEGAEFEPLVPVLRKALAKNLEDRHRTAYEFMVDLREYLRVYAATASAQHALQGLLDLEPPPTPPPPITGTGTGPSTEAGRATDVIQGTMEVAGGAAATTAAPAPPPAPTSPRPTAPRAAFAPTVAVPARRAPSVAAPVRPAPTPAPRRPAAPVARPAAESRTSPWVFVTLGVVVLAVGGAAAYFALGRRAVAPTPQPTPLAAVPSPQASIVATPTPAQPTPEPAPTFAAPQGRAAGSLRAAQTAFARGDYDRALASAQAALREDPGNAEAQKLVDSSLNGQRATARFQAAQAAIDRGDLTAATSEAEAGRALAPWDARGPEILGRIQSAQQRSQQRAREQGEAQRAGEITGLLNQADTAMEQHKYDLAVALYDEVLKRDPQNARAGIGRTGALGARAAAQAATSASAAAKPAAGGHTFVSGKTVAQSSDTRAAGSAPEGFQAGGEVVAHKASQAATLPGKIIFEVKPEAVRPGDRYTVTAYLLNEGNAPIQLRDLNVTTTVNGRKAGGAIPLQVVEVAPSQRATLLSQSDLWKEEFASWTMEVTVRTALGETYRNQVTWK
jgi:tetratricopeptide (TPR) repeat protein